MSMFALTAVLLAFAHAYPANAINAENKALALENAQLMRQIEQAIGSGESDGDVIACDSNLEQEDCYECYYETGESCTAAIPFGPCVFETGDECKAQGVCGGDGLNDWDNLENFKCVNVLTSVSYISAKLPFIYSRVSQKSGEADVDCDQADGTIKEEGQVQGQGIKLRTIRGGIMDQKDSCDACTHSILHSTPEETKKTYADLSSLKSSLVKSEELSCQAKVSQFGDKAQGVCDPSNNRCKSIFIECGMMEGTGCPLCTTFHGRSCRVTLNGDSVQGVCVDKADGMAKCANILSSSAYISPPTPQESGEVIQCDGNMEQEDCKQCSGHDREPCQARVPFADGDEKAQGVCVADLQKCASTITSQVYISTNLPSIYPYFTSINNCMESFLDGKCQVCKGHDAEVCWAMALNDAKTAMELRNGVGGGQGVCVDKNDGFPTCANILTSSAYILTSSAYTSFTYISSELPWIYPGMGEVIQDCSQETTGCRLCEDRDGEPCFAMASNKHGQSNIKAQGVCGVDQDEGFATCVNILTYVGHISAKPLTKANKAERSVGGAGEKKRSSRLAQQTVSMETHNMVAITLYGFALMGVGAIFNLGCRKKCFETNYQEINEQEV